jgi:hypothetical protein
VKKSNEVHLKMNRHGTGVNSLHFSRNLINHVVRGHPLDEQMNIQLKKATSDLAYFEIRKGSRGRGVGPGLCLSIEVNSRNPGDCAKSLHFVPTSDAPLSGTIAYLTFKHCENVSDEGIVNVSWNTIFGSDEAKNSDDLPSAINCLKNEVLLCLEQRLLNECHHFLFMKRVEQHPGEGGFNFWIQRRIPRERTSLPRATE